MDVLPTVLAAAGIVPDRQLDGANLLPYLTGRVQGTPHEVMHWQLAKWFAVHRGWSKASRRIA